MPNRFTLVVETATKEHFIPVGNDEAVAVKMLTEEQRKIGMGAVVTVADRLALNGTKIVSMRIQENN